MRSIALLRKAFFICLFILIPVAVLRAQEDPEAIFTRAVDRVLTSQMELSIHIRTTESNGRTAEKAYDILMGRFGEEDMMRMVMQEPERARGVTIVITQLPGEEGIIEVFTPSNGKVRKMKATPENMERVGSSYILSDYSSSSMEEMQFTMEGTEELEGSACDVIGVREEGNPEGMKARFLIEKSSARIREIRILDEGGQPTSVTALSDYRPVEGLQGKVQPMNIHTEDLKEKTVTDMEITRVAHRPDLKKEDFVLEGITE